MKVSMNEEWMEWFKARELIAQNHECVRTRAFFFYIYLFCSSQNHQEERMSIEYWPLRKRKSKQSKTQGVCSLVQAQGRAPLAPVSPLWVVGHCRILRYSLIAAMCLLISICLEIIFISFSFSSLWKLLSRQNPLRWHSALLFPIFPLQSLTFYFILFKSSILPWKMDT